MNMRPSLEKISVIELSNPALLNIVKKLPSTGIVEQRDDYCYLKIDDDFIHLAQPYLAQYGNIIKPLYFDPPDDMGAHISIIYPEEKTIPIYLPKICSFTVTGFARARFGSKDYFVLLVESPELAALRRKHSLASNPTFKGQEIFFHITIGVLLAQK